MRARPPVVLLVLAGLGVLFLAFPVAAVLIRAPWGSLGSLLARDDIVDAIRLSLLSSVAAAALATVLGVPLAWVLARLTFPGRSLVRAAAVLPVVLPPTVAGLALLLAFGRRGVAGRWLESVAGISLPFSPAGVVGAEAFVGLPFLVLAVEAGLRAADRRYEEAAATLGAGPWTRFRRVTLPLVAPSLAAGVALAWARALGEFGATITFAGSLPGRTETMPLAVYRVLERDPAAAVALSVVLLAICTAVLVGLRDRWLPAR